MQSRHRENRAILLDHIDNRPVGGKRHGGAADHVDQLVEADDRGEALGEAGEKGERVALLDEGALARLLGTLALCDFVLQALVGALERGRALPDPRLELAVGAAQRLLALAQRLLGCHPLGDIDRMAEHVGGALPVVRQDVAVHPDPRLPAARNHAHQAGVLAVLRDPIEVVVEQIAGVGRQEIAQVLADAVPRLVAERAGSGRIDRQEGAVEIVGTDQTEAVLDQLTIPPLGVVERIGGSVPGVSEAVNHRLIGVAAAFDRPVMIPASFVDGHESPLAGSKRRSGAQLSI